MMPRVSSCNVSSRGVLEKKSMGIMRNKERFLVEQFVDFLKNGRTKEISGFLKFRFEYYVCCRIDLIKWWQIFINSLSIGMS